MDNTSKKNIEIIFIVLCYKESKDLLELSHNLKRIENLHKVIVVNSFFDDETENRIKKVAVENEYDFVSIENRGYGYGNNQGIQLALSQYDFSYVCIVNPDVQFLIRKINLPNNTNCLVAPEISTLAGKRQNPYYPYDSKLVKSLKRIGCKYNNIYLYFSAVFVNKILLKLFRLKQKNMRCIFAAHGSCVFIGKEAICRLYPLYYDQMFLYNEEEYVARKAKANRVDIIYDTRIKILHKEGRSSDDILSSKRANDLLKNKKWFDLVRNSFNTMEKYWEGKNGK